MADQLSMTDISGPKVWRRAPTRRRSAPQRGFPNCRHAAAETRRSAGWHHPYARDADGFQRGENMSPADLPRFRIMAVLTDRCTGQFDASPWVGENWITGLYLGGGRFLWGRFRDVDVASHTCSFSPDQL